MYRYFADYFYTNIKNCYDVNMYVTAFVNSRETKIYYSVWSARLIGA